MCPGMLETVSKKQVVFLKLENKNSEDNQYTHLASNSGNADENNVTPFHSNPQEDKGRCWGWGRDPWGLEKVSPVNKTQRGLWLGH